MTSISASTSSMLAYAGAAYGRSTTSASDTATSTASATASAPASATTVTLSDQARALLATQSTDKDFATVTADARSALDSLYKAANVTVPLAGGKPTIDLSGLDRRTLFAIASNSGGKFTAAEQTAASGELQRRFDAAVGPPAAAAQVTGDASVIYKAALDYLDGASAEEKATDTWTKQKAALTQGYAAAKANPGTLPSGIANDPVAAYVARAGQQGNTSTASDFNSVASGARLAFDQQYDAASKKGSQVVFDPRRNGQLVDLSGFDNQSLAAAALNQGNQFSPDEIRAAKTELNARTRASFLTAFQQAGASGDPRAFSLGLIQQYQGMTAEQRQAANVSSGFLDAAVQNYKSTSSLLAMFSQAGSGSDPLGGSSSGSGLSALLQ